MVHHEIHRVYDRRIPFSFLSFDCTKDRKRADAFNWHDDVEMLHVRSGRTTVVVGEERISAQAGDTVVINPNIIHSIGNTEPVQYHCLIVNRDFLNANYMDTQSTVFLPLVRDERLKDLFSELADTYPVFATAAHPPTEDDLQLEKILTRRAMVLRIMARLYSRYTSPTAAVRITQEKQGGIRKAILYINREYTKDLTLDEVAEISGISKFYFSREFRRITGYPFVAYVNLVRCESAKQLLAETDLTVGEICTRCGFRLFSYFTRKFTQIVGKTPSQFRSDAREPTERTEN